MPPAKSEPRSVIRFRERAARQIPGEIGVYALCDLDEVPIYVGQSKDGIRARVNRHVTSARSDVIANRQLDVWEVAHVWCWPVGRQADLDPLEAHLFHHFHKQSPLMNGTIPARASAAEPEKIRVRLLPAEEITSRRRVELRLPRQAKHFGDLLDHFLNVKDSAELRLALDAHFARLSRYFDELRSG